ncbi:MAG: hypothetical protein IOD12_09045 [Silvanigrellales bacterium]|nr:hypothetical protein [Silvanigrellales bacterium]
METHASTKSSRTLFIVDPYLVTPEIEACSFLEREWQTLAAVVPGKPVGKVERFAPAKEGVTPLRQALKNQKPLAVVCLGSFANLTEDLPWMQELGACLLEEVVNANVPFLGICFSHQLLAHSTGEWTMGPVPRAQLPASGKWEGPRVVTATHPKLRLLFLPFDAHERGLASARDLAFQWCLSETRTWSATRWTTLFHAPWQKLSGGEGRVRRFVETECPVGVECMAAHEQEVQGRKEGRVGKERTTHRRASPSFTHSRRAK